MTSRKVKVSEASSNDNSFADLGFASNEAEHFKLRAQLMRALHQVIKHRKLTQAQAAELFGVTQPRISDLMRGKTDLFSMDTLVIMLAQVGIHVGLTIKDAA